MKIAIPTTAGRLSSHFGHCEQFRVFDVDADSKTIAAQRSLQPPHHEPGVYPRWLHEHGVTCVIAGGMGSRAQNLFHEIGIAVIVGAASEAPESIVQAYLSGTLASGVNDCDH